MKNLIIVIIISLASCDRNKIHHERTLKIFNSSNELIVEDKNIKVDESDPKSLVIQLSEESRIKLELVTGARIGEDIFIELDGIITNKVRVRNAIRNGVVRLDLGRNVERIFSNEAEAVENLLPR